MDHPNRTSEERKCPDCGAIIPADALGGLCPACVFTSLMNTTNSDPIPDSRSATLPAQSPSEAALGDDTLLEDGDIFGSYRIGRLLGRGGMGEVYEAEHVGNGRRVALKVLNERLTSADDRRRFLNEGQLAASINHPHTVYIYGSEEIEGLPVIAMELLPGGTLKDRVKARGPLPAGEAVDAILQVIAGLDAASAKGILHRDVKPSNCFVDRDGKRCDLLTTKAVYGEGGDAALAHDLAMHVAASNPQYLTPAHVAPEIITKQREDLAEQARAEGKPPEIVTKMVEGRLRKSLNEITLSGQPFVKDPDVSIEKLLKGAAAKVSTFHRFEVGAGIEKRQEDFVAEVMAQVKSSSDPGKKKH